MTKSDRDDHSCHSTKGWSVPSRTGRVTAARSGRMCPFTANVTAVLPSLARNCTKHHGVPRLPQLRIGVRVKPGKPQIEQMSSGLPPKADLHVAVITNLS